MSHLRNAEMICAMKNEMKSLISLVAICGMVAMCAATSSTAVIQKRIDDAAAAGGGVVTLAAGDYVVGGIRLRSNVTLELAKGARLVVSTNHMDSSGFLNGEKAVVTGDCVTNAMLIGAGEIDGNGWRIGNAPTKRWKDLYFYRSSNIKVEGVTLRNSARFTCHFKECDGVTVRGVTIRSTANHNNDGIDIEAKNVLVEDCDIISEDDAICFKSDNPHFAVENCVVRRCRVSSNCNFIKLGTGSSGVFRNINVYDCEVACREPLHGVFRWKDKVPSSTGDQTGISAIALELVDGGIMEDITVSNITIGAGVQTPIFIRQGQRGMSQIPDRKSVMRRILIENVKAIDLAASRIPCSITGVPGLRPRDITLRRIRLVFPGGTNDGEVMRHVPEAVSDYPENRMFGRGVVLPAYGFYLRHVDNIRFDDVKLTYTDKEIRPPVVMDDTTGVTFSGCEFRSHIPGTPPVYNMAYFRSHLDDTHRSCCFWAPENAGKGGKQVVPLIVGLYISDDGCLQLSGYTPIYALAQKAGWAFVAPNFGVPSASPLGCGSDLSVQDIVDAVAYAKSHANIDSRRVYMIGRFGGGHLAMLALGRHPEIFAAVAAYCPVTDLLRWHAESIVRHPGREISYARMLESACGGTPEEVPDEYAHRSPIAWLSRAQKAGVPTYIATGLHDGWSSPVPVGQAIRGFNALCSPFDRISEDQICAIQENRIIPKCVESESSSDSFCGGDKHIIFRRTSGNVRLTLFADDSECNLQDGFDFLSRQRKGDPVDWQD